MTDEEDTCFLLRNGNGEVDDLPETASLAIVIFLILPCSLGADIYRVCLHH